MEETKFPVDLCLKCTICTSYCPVVRVNGNFPGPKHLGPDLERHRLHTRPVVDELADYCLNCKTCEIACPENVKITLFNTRAKGELAKRRGLSFRNRLLSRPEILGQLCSATAPLTNRLLGARATRVLLNKVLGLSYQPFPSYAPRTLKKLLPRNGAKNAKKIAYFSGCYANYNDPQIGQALATVLARQGYEVFMPPQTCCGLPAIANGDLDSAYRKAQYNISSLQEVIDSGMDIITTCTSCAMVLRSEYKDLFSIQGAKEVAARVYDFGEFLLQLYEQGVLNADFREQALSLAYHAPCHLKALGIGLPGLEVLRLLGVKIHELDAGCCGLAGTYGFKREKYETSMDIGKPLFQAIARSGADRVVTECPMCKVRIEHATGTRVVHPVTIICSLLSAS